MLKRASGFSGIYSALQDFPWSWTNVLPNQTAEAPGSGACASVKNLFDKFARSRGARHWVGRFGLLLVVPFAVWLVLGIFGAVPSMLQVFGVEGLRIPASVVISGLLIAAIAYWDYDAD
jgi:hypothetical protein